VSFLNVELGLIFLTPFSYGTKIEMTVGQNKILQRKFLTLITEGHN
jgi:hypothetical protein